MRLDWIIIFTIMLIIAVAAFSYALYNKVKILSLGASEERYDNPGYSV